jgi:hypothetical protein
MEQRFLAFGKVPSVNSAQDLFGSGNYRTKGTVTTEDWLPSRSARKVYQ